MPTFAYSNHFVGYNVVAADQWHFALVHCCGCWPMQTGKRVHLGNSSGLNFVDPYCCRNIFEEIRKSRGKLCTGKKDCKFMELNEEWDLEKRFE
jgi:hypothetical protein